MFTTIQPYLDRLVLHLSTGRRNIAGIGIPVLLLTTTGRKTGKPRTAPLLYLPSEDGETFYVIGSRGRRTADAGWYYNIEANEQVSITLQGQTLNYRASILKEPTRSVVWQHFVPFKHRFIRYQQRILREIPVVRLSPRKP